MGWKGFTEMMYYVLLKHGQVLTVVLCIIVGILVFANAQRFGLIVLGIENAVITTCESDFDCFESCEKCVSVKSNNCEPNLSMICSCINRTCTQIT